MLLRPIRRITDKVSDIKNIHIPKRDIFIYTNGDINKNELHICLINDSVQVGNLNGRITPYQTLHSTNFYYGKILNPFRLNDGQILNINKLRLNPDAIVIFYDYGYLHKLVNRPLENEITVTIFDNMFNGMTVCYENGDEILPSKPIYYNLDHQIIKENDEMPFYLNDFIQISKEFLSPNGANTYKLDDLIDENTCIGLSQIIYDDPYNLLNNINQKIYQTGYLDSSSPIYNNKLTAEFIIKMIGRLGTAALRAYLNKYIVIYDYNEGMRLVEARRTHHMDSYETKDENIEFTSAIENEWEIMMDLDLKIRLTVVYQHNKTFIQVLPVKNNIKTERSIYKEMPITIKSLIEDFYFA